MSCGVGCRHGSDPTIVVVVDRPTAVILTGPLAWELPYAMGVALKKMILEICKKFLKNYIRKNKIFQKCF